MAKNKSALAVVDGLSDEEKLKHYERILELGANAIDRQKEYEAAKENAKELKDIWESAALALQQAIERANDPQRELTFSE